MNSPVPKHTSPLAKAIRTSEGILVYLINLVLGLGAIIDPSKLPPVVAAKWAAVLAIAHLVARTGLKILAVQRGLNIGDPIDPQALIDKTAADIASRTGAGPTIDEIRDLIEVAVARGIKSSQLPLSPPTGVT